MLRTMKGVVFRGCNAVWFRETRIFRGTYCLSIQSRKLSELRSQQKQAASCSSQISISLRILQLYNPEDNTIYNHRSENLRSDI